MVDCDLKFKDSLLQASSKTQLLLSDRSEKLHFSILLDCVTAVFTKKSLVDISQKPEKQAYFLKGVADVC